MSAELAMAGERPADADRRIRRALAFVAAFLAVEPVLRVLMWWPSPDARAALHSDVIWLSLALCLALAAPLGADIRAIVERRRWLVATGLIWVLAAVGSALLVDNRSPAVALRWPFYLGFALCLLVALRRRPTDGSAVLVATVLGFLAMVTAIAALLASASLPAAFDWVADLPGAFNIRNPGYEALAVVMIGSLYRPPSAAIVGLLRLGAVVGWAFLFWSGGRGSVLAALVTLGMTAALAAPRDRGRWLVEVFLLAVLGAGISLLHTPPNGALGFWRAIGFDWMMISSNQGSTDVSTGRFAIWAESVRAIAAHPWFGIGEGQMRHLLVTSGGMYPQPHNLLLQGPLAWGLAGGAAFLVAVAFPLWRALRRNWRRSMRASPAVAGFAVALAMAVQSTVDGTLFHPRPVIMFLIGCCLALAAPRTVEELSTSGT